MGRPTVLEGDLVAIRTHYARGHLVGRVVDSHQGIYLVERHVRGTSTFSAAVDEVSAHQVAQVLHADTSQPIVEAMERLWLAADGWWPEGSPQRRPEVAPAPLTHRPRLPDQ